MRYTYMHLLHVRGLSPSSPANDEEIFTDNSGDIRAILTSDPSKLGDRLDNSRALATLLIKGLMGGTGDGTPDERVAAQVRRAREERAQKFPNGLFLYFEANGEIDAITPHAQTDCGSFILALDGLPQNDIRARHDSLLRSVLAAVGLGIAHVAGFEQVADAIVFSDAAGKAIYGFNFKAGLGEVLVSRSATLEELRATRNLVSKIAGDSSLDRVIRLLNESMEPNPDRLRKFLSAWMAMEVFVNKYFERYQKRFWDDLSASVTQPIRDRYLKRIQDVMKDKYRLSDKFVVISADLDPSEAEGDMKIFHRAKDPRDDFSHGNAIDESALPVAEIQALVRKFLYLHLTCTSV